MNELRIKMSCFIYSSVELQCEFYSGFPIQDHSKKCNRHTAPPCSLFTTMDLYSKSTADRHIKCSGLKNKFTLF